MGGIDWIGDEFKPSDSFRSQSCVHIKASRVSGFSELREELSSLPPVLKANSGAKVDIGVPRTSRAIIDKIGYLGVWTFHQFSMLKSELRGKIGSSKYLSKSDVMD